MKNDARNPIEDKKVQGVPAPSVSSPLAGELTCTEGQVEDLLAEGETMEADEEDDDGESTAPDQVSTTDRKSQASSQPNRPKK